MCDHKETYIGKTVGDNIVGFKSTINQHISDCRTRTSACKFPRYEYYCAMINKCLKEPYIQLNILIKLKDSQQLKFYENHFHKKNYDTINCPEYLKNNLKRKCEKLILFICSLFANLTAINKKIRRLIFELKHWN